MILLSASLAAFTVVAVMGLMMAIDLFRGLPVPRLFVLAHAGTAGLGALLAISAALLGDSRVFVNIALVVVIVILGVTAAHKRYTTGQVQKGLILTHAGLAVVCYLLLAAVIFGLNVTG